MDDSNDSSWIPKFLRSSNKGSPISTPPNERSSLLPKPSDRQPPCASASEGSTYEFEENEPPAKLWLHEFLLLLRGSVPVILAYTLQNSLQTFSVLIVGRLSPEALATAAFSYMFAMSTAWLIALGGSTALDTLASSTFTGSKNPHDLGILLQRAFLVLTAMYIPVAILWACSAPVFRLLGQEEYICIDSAKFLTALIPGGLGYIYFESMKKYLQAQEIMRPGTYVLLITSPLNVALNYLFVYTFNLHLIGAPLATGLSYWLSFLLLVLYARFIAGSACWGGWSRLCYQNLSTFARLAILGVVHVGTEWWAFEIVALAAGRLGTIPLAAQSVIMTTDQVMNTIPFGIGVAASARVGNLLGAKNAKGAARAANVAAWLSMVMGVLVLIVLMAVKDFYAKIFNDDVNVIRLTAEVMPYVALFQIADGLNGSCGGSLRGMGRQHIGAAVNIVSYYMGALPLGIWLAFHGWGLAGLWVGQCIALYLVGAIEWVIVAWSDWEYQVEKAFERMDSGERAEIGGGLVEGQTNGGVGGGV
ncbi:mate-domain-containing protein [Hyaloscypha finlandica]|nr:mate-domain-containing protein [Hyaloscypha finlandica]